ncbi:hypothetical protein M8C21_022928, partial [Ambrosia artemisiifolia]
NFIGEDLDSLSLKELQNKEKQLETALRRLRLRKAGGNGETEETQDQGQLLTVMPCWMLQYMSQKII